MINPSSLSVDAAYTLFCYLAAKRDDIFVNFKVHHIYCRISMIINRRKVAAVIFSLFVYKNINVLSEIGVAYAAQSNVLLYLFHYIQYYLVDLPEVLALAERGLYSILMNHNVRFFDGNHLYHNIHSDFVISVFAFSELFRTVQDLYLHKIILNSNAGYFTWNDGLQHKTWNTDAYSLNDILSIIPASNAILSPQTIYQNNLYQNNQKTPTVIWRFI